MKIYTCEDCLRKGGCEKRFEVRQPVQVGSDKYCGNFISQDEVDFFNGGARNVRKNCNGNCKCNGTC